MTPQRRRTGSGDVIFVDRDPPKRVFEDAALNIPRKGCLLRVWHGVGGQGKTALARELFRISDGHHEPSYRHLRRAMLDLHERPKTDPDRLMVWVRNGFAGAGVDFPASTWRSPSCGRGRAATSRCPPLRIRGCTEPAKRLPTSPPTWSR